MASVAIQPITHRPWTRSRVADDQLVVDTDSFEVHRNGHRIVVQPLVFELLVYLLRHHGRVVTKEELIREVWHCTAISDGAISQAVCVLRKALGDDGRSPRLIRTVHKFGYVLAAAGTTAIALRETSRDARRANA